ncbi:uncharacterized protein LOC110990694 [Acanthaster planci]|uniref:Uncharacterized protein LOC110990694 n=1 Tax=Acanthaster planci TaxID=133434 RepID=A0A8B8A292_ACAPL|nr:uncharacterized protein LOC110990694 [Acanthaster planci]
MLDTTGDLNSRDGRFTFNLSTNGPVACICSEHETIAILAQWFAQVEAQFPTRKIIMQDTKFAYVIGLLPPEEAREVRDILIAPPDQDRYDHLKAEVIRRTSISEQKRLHQLLIAEELGDRKPTQLWRRMKQLLGENTLEEKILKQLFLQRLPANAQFILASTSQMTPIQQLAELADKIIEVSIPHRTHTVSAVSPAVPPSGQPSLQTQALQAKVDELTQQVNALTSQLMSQQRGRRRTRDSTPSRPRSSSRGRSPSHAGKDCRYHWRYGTDAKRCVSPCSYKPRQDQQQGNSDASD